MKQRLQPEPQIEVTGSKMTERKQKGAKQTCQTMSLTLASPLSVSPRYWRRCAGTAAAEYRDRNRRHRRRLLSDGWRHGERAVQASPGIDATARVTGGSVDNLKLVGTGQSEVAFTMVDAARDALKGEDKFKGSPVELRTLMVLYPNRMHVVSVEGKGIDKMSDLKGKRVSTGSPGSATEVMAFRVIEAAGLDRDKDMRRERLGVAKSTNALKDGKIDAYFWVGGLPTAAVTDLGATPGVKLKLVDHADVVEKMNAKYGTASTARA